MPLYTLPVFSLTFAYLLLGLFYLVLYLKSRRRAPDHLVFSALTVALAGYSFCCFRLYLAQSPGEGRTWQVAQSAFAIPAAVLLVHFFWAHLGIPKIRRLWAGYGAAAVFLILDLFTHTFFTHEPSVKKFRLAGMAVRYVEVQNGPSSLLFYLCMVLGLGLVLSWLLRAPPEEVGRRLDPVRLGFTIFALSILNDIFVTSGVYAFLYLSEYGYFAIVVGMAAILLDRYSALQNDLERAVEARTRELRRLAETLAQSERLAATGMLAATLSHEVRNPLAVILSALDVLKDEVESQQGREILASAREEVRRIAAITHDLLTLSRPRRERGAPIDVNILIAEFLVFYSPKLTEAGVEVETASHKGIPSVSGPPGLVQQILLNLVKNATEALPAGGKIWIRTAPASRGLRIEVEDTGPGVDPRHAARIFDPFFSTKKGEGNGLGLFITREIVDSMGGQIEVESQPGRGATFRVLLPAAGEEDGLAG